MKAADRALTFAALTAACSWSCALARKFPLNKGHGPAAFLTVNAAEDQGHGPAAFLTVNAAEDQAQTPWCMGNVFPHPTKDYHIGLSNSPQVFPDDDLQQLKDILSASGTWGIGRQWEFKAKVTSGFPMAMNFAMEGDHGFLNFSVPIDASSEEISVSGLVKTVAEEVSLVYRGQPNELEPHEVIFRQVCLRQRPCEDFTGCVPSQKYQIDPSKTGDSFESCCASIFCKDTIACTPTTKYGNHSDADTRLGNTIDLCCEEKFCANVVDSVCSGTSQPKVGTGLRGSTREECCELAYCRDFTGCDPSHDTSALPLLNEDGSARIGASEDECCNVIECSLFDCSKSDMWTNQSNPSGKGHTFSHCCDPLYCSNYTCAEATKYVMKSAPPTQGYSDERCCDGIYCNTYTCSNQSLSKMIEADTRLGSTDEECCEPALCVNYDCSDSNKYTKKPEMVEVGGVQKPRFGASDEACCTPLLCKDFSCTSTKWKTKESLDVTLLGGTHELCCDVIYCQNFTCTSDFDGDGNGSKWYKRADTNAMMWRGSTDEECCYPLYCNQYETQYPTQWKRKISDAPILGSTDPECYEQLFCKEFCGCKTKLGLRKIPDADKLQGSTVDECCENITTTTATAGASQPQVGVDLR